MRSALGVGLFLAVWAGAQDTALGRRLYEERCAWCHGSTGKGDGPAAPLLHPPPRNFVQGDYKIRSTRAGHMPTREDLFRTISRGLPGTPMAGWADLLNERERWALVDYLRTLSPRFGRDPEEVIPLPQTSASVSRGREAYRRARCALCHGEEGRGDGPLTAVLAYEWGLPFPARDLTAGWAFRGGHTAADIYRRITGGLNGTPMAGYETLLTDQERWDLAHYVLSLAPKKSETESFLLRAAFVAGDLPEGDQDPAWALAPPLTLPLGGQVIEGEGSTWALPTAVTAQVRALWNGREVAFLVAWNDPTGPDPARPDAAFLQFALRPEARPYFVSGDEGAPVRRWCWQVGAAPETRVAAGPGKIRAFTPDFTVSARWAAGRWRLVFRHALGPIPRFRPGTTLPFAVSVQDGANGEAGERRALSTWYFVTLAQPPGAAPWLAACAMFCGALLAEYWLLRRWRG